MNRAAPWYRGDVVVESTSGNRGLALISGVSAWLSPTLCAIACDAADSVVPVTTATEGYLPFEWRRPGALVAHVSLGDVLPDVVAGVDRVLVDYPACTRLSNHRVSSGRHASVRIYLGVNS
jgi:hypothetical protein